MIIAKISLNENRGMHQSLSLVTIRKVENAKKRGDMNPENHRNYTSRPALEVYLEL